MKRTICLDFDGVIHSYRSGWKGVAVIPDGPVPGAIEFITQLMSEGYEVAIYSARSRSFRGRRAMKRWLRGRLVIWYTAKTGNAGWGVRQRADEMVSAIKWPWFKPPAWVTIDDRAICFDGKWPTMEELRAFKAWKAK